MLFHSWGSAAALTLPDTKMGMKGTKLKLFMNISNNTAPFVSIKWHQKEPLGCVVYSHCPTNDIQQIYT